MWAWNVPYAMSAMSQNNPRISLRYNVFFVFTLCFVKTSAVGYWKRMMVMHEDVCNHWLGAGCREEIRTRVPSVSPCHTPCLRLFKQDLATEGNVLSMSMKYNFNGERNPIILSESGQRRPSRQKRQRTHSPCECSGQYFQHQICQLARFKIWQIDRDWSRRIMAC